ncbi:MAG: cytochrome b [Pseudomonadota bacterium]|nr:cytochrome b [Pseudomonadota bacterium]
MSSNDLSSRYAASSRWMHWTMFALVLLAYLFINVFDLFPKGTAARVNLLASHFLAGLAVLLLVLPRLWLRLRNGQPPIVPPSPHWSELAAKLTHLALYAFLLIQPILGVVTLQIGGKAVALFGVTVLPSFVAHPDRALGHQIEEIHSWIGTIFYYVIALHILAALWHHYRRHDNTLQRML